MSILSPDKIVRVGPEIRDKVDALVARNSAFTEYVFGTTDSELLLTKSYLSLASYDDDGELAGLVCFNDHPNVPSIPPWEWTHWLYNLYGISDVDPLNSAWIHYVVADPRYRPFFLKLILQTFFSRNEIFEKILLVVPPHIKSLDFLEGFGTRVWPKNLRRVQTIVVLNRQEFECGYKIRRAVEEDNDDLVAIIPKILEEHYGPYYVAEILTLHENRQIIVAEHGGRAIAVLILNDVVNYELLNEEFELVCYNGLRKHNVEDDLLSEEARSRGVAVADDADIENEKEISLRKPQFEEESSKSVEEEPRTTSEDDFSLVNLSSSLLFDYLDEESGEEEERSVKSIESQFSACILSEDHNDHLFTNRLETFVPGNDNKKPRKFPEKSTTLPKFRGEPNAFALEVSAVLPGHEDCYGKLYAAAFQCFPDKDYCVASFPSIQSPSFIARYFVRVPPRNVSVFPQEVYVLHRNAIFRGVSVRVATLDDKSVVSQLLKTLDEPGVIEEQFKSAVDVDNSNFSAFVLSSGTQVVGVAVISEEVEPDCLDVHYNVESWMNRRQHKAGMHGRLDSLIISPIFQRYNQFFLRELHRLSNFSVFYYRLKPCSHKNSTILNAIGHLAPVLPRIIQEYDPKITEQYEVPTVVTMQDRENFALYLSTSRLTSISRVEINHRILVVGAGDTAVAFLASMLYTHAPRALIVFTNVTVLSPHGAAYHKHPNRVRDMMFVNNGHYDRRYMDSICLKTYVHQVTGVMTSIDRKEKYVSVNDDTQLPYDLMVLVCGQQFQKPAKKGTKRTEYPENVFIINTEADAANALATLKIITGFQPKKAVMVVYGHFLEALCCLAALIEFGVSGDRLVYVDPSPDPNLAPGNRHDHLTSIFNNQEVEMAVMAALRQQGVTIYEDYNFVEWQYEPTYKMVVSAKFQSKYKIVDVELAALFMYETKSVSARTFQAITRCGLVFDGHLVIDQNNRTNDPNIFGVGTLTKYSRKYYADHLMHKYFNCEEIGHALGRQIRELLVPPDFMDSDGGKELSKKPVVKYCRLPGGLCYLSVTKPGKPVPLDISMSKDDYGKVLVTGNTKNLDGRGFFRLHLNKYDNVETITCLAKFELNVHNLISLYGKHEKLLNNLVLRFEMMMIADLFEYFKEPWCCAIYHNRFPFLMAELDRMLTELRSPNGKPLLDELTEKLEENEWKVLSATDDDDVEQIFKDAGYFRILEEKVLEFLHQNYSYLPMYALPMLVSILVHEVRNNPMFVEK